MFGKKKSVVGLDIGSSQIKVVESTGYPKATKILTVGIAPLLPDAIVDGEVMDREVVIDTIKTLFEKYKIQARDVATSISGRGVIVKKIKMDKMKRAEVSEQIRWEAEQYVPFDIDNVSLAFEIVNPDTGGGQMEVLLVAAKSEVVNSYVSLIKEIGLNPVVLDISAFAIQNIYDFNYPVLPNKLISLISIGAEITNISFIINNINHFTRDVFSATNSCSQKIQREMGLNRAQAEQLIRGEAVEGVTPEDVDKYFQEFAEEVALGIDKVIPFLPGEKEKIDRIVLCGGGALIRGLVDYLKDRFDTEVIVVNALQNIKYDTAIFEEERAEKISPVIAEAVGLSLRG
ncbi:type IV pilus assembly protein PilM [candidate division WOR-3 bacterium]|nr:type IV pilus assembly protein PilM [candidate division WOR-3 bacterium]MCK4576784.1 type IV pilus assembly protein PilM [candidate division WOR-3 bacterium]